MVYWTQKCDIFTPTVAGFPALYKYEETSGRWQKFSFFVTNNEKYVQIIRPPNYMHKINIQVQISQQGVSG